MKRWKPMGNSAIEKVTRLTASAPQLRDALIYFMTYHHDSRNWGLIKTEVKKALRSALDDEDFLEIVKE